MEKGIGMMMKAMGLDPEKIIGDFEGLKTTVTSTLKSIDERQTRIENRLEDIWKLLQTQHQQKTQPPAHTQQPQPNQPHSLPAAKQ